LPRSDAQYWSYGRGEALLWVGVGAGPLAWGLDLGFSYAITQHACSTGHHYLLHLITVLTFLLAGAGLWAAHTAWNELPEEADHERGGALGRSAFLAILGYASSIGFAVVIIAGAVPRWILAACQ
jgi:hypothetical protein